MKILIAEDNADDRKILKFNLEHNGCEVIEAKDGKEGLHMASSSKPDMIISDALMPVMDGFQFLRSIKTDSTLQSIPFIFYSAVYTEHQEAELAMSLGAEAFIVKPKDPQEFWEELLGIIEECKLRKEKTITAELIEEEEEFLRKYSHIVAAKLEEKVRELEKARTTLEAKDQEWKATFESIGDCITIHDSNYNVLLANKSCEKFLGVSQDELRSKKCFELFHGRNGPHESCPKLNAEQTGNPSETEIFEPRLNSWLNITCFPLLDKNGAVRGVVHIARDITQRKKTEIEIIIRNRISNIFLTSTKDEEMYDELLKVVLEVMESKYGVVGYIDEDRALVVPSMSRHIWDKCEVPDKTFIFKQDQWGHSSWARAIREKKSNYTNETSDLTPQGHIPVVRHISVPVMFQGEVIGLIQVANRETDYTEKDVQFLEVIGNSKIAPILNARLQRDRHEKARKLAEADLIRTNAEIYDLYNNAPCGYHLLDRDGIFVRINDTELSWLGYSREDVISKMKFTNMLTPLSMEVFSNHFRKLEESSYLKDIQLEMVRKDSTIMPVLLSATADRDEEGNLVIIRITVNDMTHFKKLEAQLRQAQKMEAIGQLASGIAHDFNNIMAAIINYAYLIKNRLKGDDPVLSQIEQISSLSMKASEITRGLLAFSRKNIANLMPVNINSVILDIGKLLSKFIGEDIDINFRLSDRDLIIMADTTHMEQIIINLATNARDAMPEGGRFTIETDLAIIGDDFVHMHGFGTRGRYALLSVTDTGIGMDEKIKQRIFEPFFTTKEVGKGTGLGLAIIYGIVKQHEGYINVYSEPGRGTTFKIYFHIADAAVPEKEEITPSDLRGHAETILLAEDEEAVRNSVKNILEQFGYRVIEAVNGDDAIDKYREHKDKIDLLLFDVIMPKKNGKEAYYEIKKITPGIKVIFTSGYSAEIIDKKGIITDGFTHILKPLSPDKLLSTIKEVLQRAKESPQ